jgi:hypothetical protein
MVPSPSLFDTSAPMLTFGAVKSDLKAKTRGIHGDGATPSNT